MKKILLSLALLPAIGMAQIIIDTTIKIRQENYDRKLNTQILVDEINPDSYMRFSHDTGLIGDIHVQEITKDGLTIEFRIFQIIEGLQSKNIENRCVEHITLIANPVLKVEWNRPGRIEMREQQHNNKKEKELIIEVSATRD